MADFVRIDEWAGFLTRDMFDRFFQEVLNKKDKDKNKKDITYFKAMKLSTLAQSVDDIWVIDEHPNIRINFRKAIPKSAKKGMFKTEEDERNAETFTIGRTAFQNKLVPVCQYLSYFTEFYDPDKELFSLYMYMKNIIDNGQHSLTIIEFKKHLLGKIFRDYHIKENIYRMVEDNHYIDATIDQKSGRVFDGPDDFTNDDNQYDVKDYYSAG